MDSECKCTYPNYTAFTGRCMTCGGFHKKDLDMSFDYKSRDWEDSNSRPVCVACLNESRAHQIPGEYEHTCGKRVDNTQLPAEVQQKIHNDTNLLYDLLDSAAREVDSYDFGLPMMDRQTEPIRNLLTEYATKLHQVEQDNKKLKDQIEEYVLDGRDKDFKGRTLLEKVKSRHEAGLLPDRFIYDEIKKFLDGAK
jgi:hypothetical protein